MILNKGPIRDTFILEVDARLQTLSKNTVDSDEFYLVEQ